MRFLMFLLILSSVSFGQLSVTSRIESYTEFKTPPRIVGNRAYYASESKVNEGQMAFVAVTGPADMVRVKAKRMTIVGNRIVIERASVEKIGQREFAITGDGTYTVEVTGFSQSDVEDYPEFEITLGDLPPKPDPEPGPTDVPPDVFDNIGQRIAKWSVGLPKRVEVGTVYKKYADELANNPTMDITKAMSQAGAERIKLLETDAPKYNDVTEKLNADIKSRWPMSKGVLSDYLTCVAKGYGVK